MKSKLLCALTFFSFFVLPSLASAQNMVRVIILSPRVGEMIDIPERDKFNIFKSIKGFLTAEIFEIPDSSYKVHFRLTGLDSTVSDTLITYSLTALRQMAEKINNFEALSEGTYKMGDNQVRSFNYIVKNTPLNFKSAKTAPVSDLTVKGEKIPEVKQSASVVFHTEGKIKDYFNSRFPKFGIFAGFSSYSSDLSDLSSVVNPVVDFLRSHNYMISYPQIDVNPNAFILYGLKFRFSYQFELAAEAGISGKTGTGRFLNMDVSLQSASLSCIVHPDILHFKWISPFLGGGFGYYKLKFSKSFPCYYKLPDEVGALESIRLSGAMGKGAVHMMCGLDYIPSDNKGIGVSLFARYLMIPSMLLKNNHPDATAVFESRVRLNSLTIGCFINYYY